VHKEAFMVSLDFLERIDIFKDLNDNQLTAIQACCQEAEFRRDDQLFDTRITPEYLWVVMDGEVSLRQDQPTSYPNLQDSIISTLSENMIFGWSSLVPPFKYRLSAYCSSRTCKVLKIERNCLNKLMEEDFKMGYIVMSEILAVVGTRFDQLREEIIKVMGQDIINRW
jgi:signal-transduction protein with cAMP-binding, CBS, and nucleotidyltransferase domain